MFSGYVCKFIREWSQWTEMRGMSGRYVLHWIFKEISTDEDIYLSSSCKEVDLKSLLYNGGAKVQVTGHRSGHRLQATGHRSGYRPQVTGQATGHRSQVRLQATDQVTGHKKTIGHWTKLFWTDVLLYKNQISQGTLMIFLSFKQY